jgi:hypothetical protein
MIVMYDCNVVPTSLQSCTGSLYTGTLEYTGTPETPSPLTNRKSVDVNQHEKMM